MLSNKKTENCFMFLKAKKEKEKEKKEYFKKYILIVFACFLKIVLKNNYTNMKNN